MVFVGYSKKNLNNRLGKLSMCFEWAAGWGRSVELQSHSACFTSKLLISCTKGKLQNLHICKLEMMKEGSFWALHDCRFESRRSHDVSSAYRYLHLAEGEKADQLEMLALHQEQGRKTDRSRTSSCSLVPWLALLSYT